MGRVIVYIDGFNLYHAVDGIAPARPWLKWLDLWALAQSLLRRGEHLTAVKYFSAYATWRHGAFLRHRRYVAALEARGVDVYLGQFKKKPMRCRECGAEWERPEEKETDVHIAVQMLADALQYERKRIERIILISADTDFAPALKIIRQTAPHCSLLVAPPPGRFESCRELNPTMRLSPGRLEKCLLPATIRLDTGKVIERPRQYTPPSR